MCDFAAAMADRVIPRAPVRQWVLTVPHGLRGKMAYDPALTTEVLRQLIAAVSAWLRARARRLGIRGVIKTGAVRLVTYFDSDFDRNTEMKFGEANSVGNSAALSVAPALQSHKARRSRAHDSRSSSLFVGETHLGDLDTGQRPGRFRLAARSPVNAHHLR
ncbi:MAG: hypothetical protein ABUS79_13590 [Pseudomonadota bacterium]